jgi:hypothetical protein
VTEAVREQTPLLQLYPGAAASRCIQGFAAQLTNGRGAAAGDLRGFFSRVVDFMGRKR